MKNRDGSHLLLAFTLVFLALGFASQAEEGDALKPEGADIPFLGIVKSAIAPRLKDVSSIKVAVLPATAAEQVATDYAESKDVKPVELLRTVFFGRFSLCPYEDLHIRDVDRVLQSLGGQEVLGKKTPQELGEWLGVDALVYLDVKRAANVSAGVHSYTGYDATARMIDVASGKELWRAELEFANRGGLISFKSSQVVELVEFENENRDRKKAFRLAAEEWSRRVVADLRSKTGTDDVVFEN